MPAEQGLGLDEEPPPAPAAKEPAQPGEQRPVAGSQRRAGHLAAEDRHLVAEHDDFDRQFVVVTPREPEQLEDSDERQVEEGQRHGPASSPSSLPTKVQLNGPDDILGTHTAERASTAANASTNTPTMFQPRVAASSLRPRFRSRA